MAARRRPQTRILRGSGASTGGYGYFDCAAFQLVMALRYTLDRRLVRRCALDHGLVGVEVAQRQTLPSTWLMGLMRLAGHTWQS